MGSNFNELWNDPEFITDEEKAKIDKEVARIGRQNNAIGSDALAYIDSFLTAEEIAESNLRVSRIKPHIITGQNSPELAQRIKEASAQILKRNYQLYKDLEDK